MQNTRNVIGLVVAGVCLGWAGPKLISAVTSNAVVIEQNAQMISHKPQVSHNQTGDMTAGLALASSKPVLPEDQAVADVSDLSMAQQAAISLLETSAREVNQTGAAKETQDLRFDHLAVKGLTVRHFYTVNYNYTALDRTAFMDAQTATIRQALCANAGLRDLIQELGLTYSYNYLSQDDRLLGNITVEPQGCTG